MNTSDLRYDDLKLDDLRLKPGDLERFKPRIEANACEEHDWECIEGPYDEDGLLFKDFVCLKCGAAQTICVGDNSD